MKKALLLLLIFPFIQVACEKSDFDCERSVFRHFDITGLEFTPSIVDGNVPLREGDSVRFENFYFKGYLQANYYSSESGSGFSLLQQAYATAPCPVNGWNGSEEKLAGIYLISLGHYNATIQPGDTLKDGYRINNELPSEYISTNSQNIRWQQLTIKLTEKPAPEEYQSFKLIYQLTNGERYEATTPRFKLY